MKEGFVKAYCEKSKQYYGLKIEEIDNEMQVTDFYDIDSVTAKTLASSINIPGLKVAPNLRECYGDGCHNRKVAGCNCAKKKWNCNPDSGYRYQCIFCDELHIFSTEEGAEEVSAENVGQKIRLAQGQEVVISSAEGAATLEHILIGVGWDIALQGSNMDVDSSVFVKSSRTERFELVYYGHLEHSSGCVVHRGDNLVGGKFTGSYKTDDSENIDVYLTRVPEEFDELYFVLNIYDCENRRQSFRNVRNLYIRLKNAKNNKLLAEYEVEPEMMDKTGLIIGKAYRKGGKWLFKALGKAVNVYRVNNMIEYCRDD